MPDELLDRLRRFHDDAFPLYQSHFRLLVDDGQHPTTLFIGCAFIPASTADHAGTGPYHHYEEPQTDDLPPAGPP